MWKPTDAATGNGREPTFLSVHLYVISCSSPPVSAHLRASPSPYVSVRLRLRLGSSFDRPRSRNGIWPHQRSNLYSARPLRDGIFLSDLPLVNQMNIVDLARCESTSNLRGITELKRLDRTVS